MRRTNNDLGEQDDRLDFAERKAAIYATYLRSIDPWACMQAAREISEMECEYSGRSAA